MLVLNMNYDHVIWLMEYAINIKRWLLLLLKGTRAWGYFDALITLHKDLSVSENPGFTVQLWGLKWL
jgi:hypothetical protein